jgi:hypothetical protein
MARLWMGRVVSERLKGVVTMEWDAGNMALAVSAVLGLLVGVVNFFTLAESEPSVPDLPGGTSH